MEARSYLEPQKRKGSLKWKETVKDHVSQEEGGEGRGDNREREACQEENHEMCQMLLRSKQGDGR